MSNNSRNKMIEEIQDLRALLERSNALLNYKIGGVYQVTSQSCIFRFTAKQGKVKESGLLQVFRYKNGQQSAFKAMNRRFDKCFKLRDYRGLCLPEPVVEQIDDNYLIYISIVCKGTAKTATFSEKDVALLGSSVALGLSACHAVSHYPADCIAHRNIKPDCIYQIDKQSFVLGRFESCGPLYDTTTQGRTDLYTAPELYKGIADERTDIYALGMTMYALLKKNRLPIAEDEAGIGESKAGIIQRNNEDRKKGIPLPAIPNVSSELMRIILKACHPDYQRRYDSVFSLQNDLNRYLKKSYRTRKLIDIDLSLLRTKPQDRIQNTLQAKTSFSQDWRIVKFLGRGGFGYTFEVARENAADTEPHYAAKVVSLPRRDYISSYSLDLKDIAKQARDVNKEIRIQTEFSSHPNIVKIISSKEYKVKDNPTEWFVVIIMELLTPITSKSRLNEREVISLGMNVCDALTALHSSKGKGYKAKIHRDVKPTNILYSSADNCYKLCDFGIAREISGAALSSCPGTEGYKAFEMLSMKYDHTVDIFALGITLYELCNRNHPPFAPLNKPANEEYRRQAMLDHRSYTNPLLPPMADGSEELLKIVSKACSRNPSNRYRTAAEMKEALEALLRRD